MNDLNHTAASAIGDDHREALLRPTDRAEGLPGAAYGAAFLEQEREHLFPRTWCPVAVGASIPNPGDAIPVDLAGWPIILVRAETGEIRAFHNICRHRAMRVLLEPCQGAATLRCVWHSWAYGLDGRLVATPNFGGEGVSRPPGFDRAAFGLKPIRTAQWLDYVFVDIDGTAPPLAEHMAPLDAFLHGIDLAGLVHAASWTDTYPGNWKISVESAIEDYHLPWGHPELMAGVASRGADIRVGGDCFSATTARAVYAAEPDPTSLRAQSLPLLNRADGVDPKLSHVINVFPVGLMAVLPDHALLGLCLPDGPDRTRLEFHYYVTKEGAGPDYAEARARLVEGWAHVALQDLEFVRGVQENAAIRDLAGVGTIFSPYWEGAVHHFQKTVLAVMDRR